MAELLLELFSEEIPARMQARAAEDLKGLVTGKLKAAGLEFSSADAYVTPRRLTLVVDGLPDKQPDVSEERRGPRVDAPEKAIQGFLGSTGLTLDQCEKRDTGKGEFWFVVIEKKGAATADVLPEIILSSIRELPWPKSMRWGRNTFRWVRPLHHILAVFDGAVLDGGLDLGETQLTFTGETRGHRFLAPDAVTVGSFHEYRTEIGGAFVMLDREDRKEAILAEAKALCEAEGLVLRDDPGLLDEVCGLVEWPVPLMGRIDAEFMSVPPEVLITSMRSHQKYFAVEKPDGALADRFILVSNMASEETRNANIVAGNEKVLRARLSDAKFFWDQDRAVKLADRRDALRDVKFYDKLGTMADKVERVSQLAAEIAPMVGADADTARHAATLAKADLTTGMVGEFPELQGLMGRYYALDAGEDAQVADAIAQHYSPVGPTDTCPTAPVSVAVAMADKIDTLVGFFGIGETPTGSKDPFALRRAALGVIRLIIENDLRIDLHRLIDASEEIYGPTIDSTGGFLLAFFVDRLKVHLRGEGVRHDLIEAVFSQEGTGVLVRLLAQTKALSEFLESDDGVNLLRGYRRASNILVAEESKGFTAYPVNPDPSLMLEEAELRLFDALNGMVDSTIRLVREEQFEAAMIGLASLREPIDAFFESVVVNADDPALRINRLKLLATIRDVMESVADFSKIQG